MLGKHLSIVQVAVQAPDGIPDSENQEVVLVGWVRLNQPIDQDVHFRWELPSGVHIVEGQDQDSWSGMKAGETAETRLRVTGFSQESMKLVVLQGFVTNGEAEFGNSAVITSRPEDSYDMLASSSTNLQKTGLPENARALLSGKIIR
jgi:hypothetical protein